MPVLPLKVVWSNTTVKVQIKYFFLRIYVIYSCVDVLSFKTSQLIVVLSSPYVYKSRIAAFVLCKFSTVSPWISTLKS